MQPWGQAVQAVFHIPVEPLVLASQSPRRRQLLEAAGLRFRVVVPEVQEPAADAFHDPYEHVMEAATRKARAAMKLIEVGTVIAADTTTALDDDILGKPANEEHARQILRRLSGTRHSVLTAVCVATVPGRFLLGGVAESLVQMRRLGEEEVEEYIASGQWQGKAGAYAIQDNDPFVSLISGELDTVVGLPLKLLTALLNAACDLNSTID